MSLSVSSLGLASLAAVVALCSACSGSDSSGGFSTSVPASKPVNTLTQQEQTQLCSDLNGYVDDTLTEQLKVPLCRGKALAAALQGGAKTDAEARAACKPAYEKCLTEPVDTGFDSKQMCDAPAQDCAATVGELSSCIQALPGYLQASLPDLPACDAIEIAKLSEYTAEKPQPAEPAACTAYEKKCPSDSIIGDGSSSGDGNQ